MTREHVARDYIARGWVPFPYQHTLTPGSGWQLSEVYDGLVDRIAASDNPVAILLGKPSDLVVVDIDPQNGGSAERLLERYPEARDTRVVSTPSGGWHLYFRYPEGVEKLTRVVNSVPGLPGVDLLADGSHVQAPPTARVGHPGKPDGQYTVKNSKRVADLPPELLADWLMASQKPARVLSGTPTGTIPAGDYAWATEQHRTNVKVASDAPEGARDVIAYSRIASSVRIAKAVPDDVLALGQVESDFGDLPYDVKDLAGKMRRAAEYADAHPWEELSPEAVARELPEGIREDQAWHYFDELDRQILKDVVQQEVLQRRIETDAARVVRTQPIIGEELMATDGKDPEWLITGLMPYQGSTLVIGKYKSGKSTLMLNLIHALTTGEPFLGEFAVPKPVKVGYCDLELNTNRARRWLRDVTGIDYSKLVYWPLTGKGGELDMRSKTLRTAMARQLRELGIDVLIVDPTSPVVSALGINENAASEVRPLLDSFDMLAAEAGLCGVVLAQHTGHEATDRARGSTAYQDWLDAAWVLERNGEEGDSPRSFKATGRDVYVPRRGVDYDRSTRKMSLVRSDPFGSGDSFLDESRGRTLTLAQAGEGLGLNKPESVKPHLLAAGWVQTTPGGGRGNPALWEYPRPEGDPFVEVV